MIEKEKARQALKECRRVQRMKPFIAIAGVVFIIIAAISGRELYKLINMPWTESDPKLIFTIGTMCLSVAIKFTFGFFLLLAGIVKNNKDTLLLYLAEQVLEDKKLQEDCG